MAEQNGNFAASVTNTSDYTNQYDQNDIAQNKVLALFSYIGFLFLIPLLAAKDSKYARFHTNQGIVLFIVEIVWNVARWILAVIFAFIPGVGGILLVILGIVNWVVGILFVVFAVLGIVNAVQGKAKELPLIGGIKILK